MPYWLRFDGSRVYALNLKKVKPWYKYRVYSENYIRSTVGRFEIVNGCLRTVVEIGKRLHFPFVKLQRLLVGAFKPWSKPVYNYRPLSHNYLREMVQHTLKFYYPGEIPENPYFHALLGFYANFPSDRKISLRFECSEDSFKGKDSRVFFNLMEKNRLPSYLNHVLAEAVEGFGNVVVAKREDYEKAVDTMRFLNLLAPIAIE